MRYKVYSPATDAVSRRERNNRALARQVAAEGIVLLENKGILPLKSTKVALFGSGARRTVRGGSGSGDMRERYSINIEQGLENAGIQITSRAWLDAYDRYYEKLHAAWVARIETAIRKKGFFNVMGIFDALGAEPFLFPVGEVIQPSQLDEETDTAIYVIARQAGEGTDRRIAKGDFLPDEIERKNLEILTAHYKDVIVVINCGGMIDCSFWDEIPGIGALLYIAQAGTEGGNALADILTGKCSPSGKLTDTWGMKYEDYPYASDFGHLNGNLQEEDYKEGIFVGYRWFDATNRSVRYPFGYGLSYTSFLWDISNISINGRYMDIQIQVRNTGNLPGKEVLQAYVSKPQTALNKPEKELFGFVKTDTLAPGQDQTIDLIADLEGLASFRTADHSWVVENGSYTVLIGNSSCDLRSVANLSVSTEIVLASGCKLSEQYPVWEDLTPGAKGSFTETVPEFVVTELNFPSKIFTPKELDPRVREWLEMLTTKDMVNLIVGGSLVGNCYNNTPGAVGRTTSALVKKGIPNVNFCDGPAGLNVFPEMVVTKNGSQKYLNQMPSSYNWGILKKLSPFIMGRPTDGRPCYQYMTAWPCATMQAQTWNLPLVQQLGAAVGAEMVEIGATLWLAPGMNIHRNPLCGRNFEYYSEDPYLSGKMAASVTSGVQSHKGVGVTIKHFCCNNQEDNRTHVSANVSERALREIYLRPFQICVQEAHPWAVMSSYNRVNGEYVNNNGRLCNDVLRGEWGFDGLVMTDWSATGKGVGSHWICPSAGNDLIMPGSGKAKKDILSGLRSGKILRQDVICSAQRVLSLIAKSNVSQVE